MKYMLAMLCSKPAATNALIGNITAATRSTTDRADNDIHTARQTRVLASTPEITAWPKPRFDFASAIATARCPTLWSPASSRPDITTSIAVAIAPTRLPANTTTRHRCGGDIRKVGCWSRVGLDEIYHD